MVEAVYADHIAQIVSRWTGIPVDRVTSRRLRWFIYQEDG